MAMIVCVLSGRLAVSARWTRNSIVQREVGSRDKNFSKGTWIAAKVLQPPQ